MLAPVERLKKNEIIWLSRNRCNHGHTYLEHYSCYLQEYPRGREDLPVGFADIEASNLTATFGIVYTYCIKEEGGKIYRGSVTTKDLHSAQYDKNVLKSFIKDTKRFSRLIFHYGNDRRFDLPFLRTRCVYWKLDFPEWKSMTVSDSYPILRNKFKLHSNRLETACSFFGIEAKAHKLNPDIWLKMITGNPKLMKEALKYIMTHNEEDVISLEKLWKRISKYARMGNTSI